MRDMVYPVDKGDVWLLPAVVGKGVFRPSGPVALLEIAIPAQTTPAAGTGSGDKVA